MCYGGLLKTKAFHENRGQRFIQEPLPEGYGWQPASVDLELLGRVACAHDILSTGVISQSHVLVGANSSQANHRQPDRNLADTHSRRGKYAIRPAPPARPQSRRTHGLAGAKSAQANLSNSLAISQTHVITGANSSQANARAIPELSAAVRDLWERRASRANASSAGAMTQAHALVVTASAQVNSSTAIAIIQVNILSGATWRKAIPVAPER